MVTRRKRTETIHYAGAVDGVEYGVVTVRNSGDKRRRRKLPCAQCPWRADLPTGVFPAEAFRHSANTAEDMSAHTFACHMAGIDKSQTCAGFLLRGADHNLAIRLNRDPTLWEGLTDGGLPLYDGYVSMAVANGVDPADEALARCRLSDREEEARR